MNNSNKAIVAKVDFGFTQVDGLMLPDGTYAIAMAQANKLLVFSSSTQNALKSLKLLLGKDSELIRAKTELANNPAYILTIPQFRTLIRELDKRGNATATAFIDAVLEEAIERRFDTAFCKTVEEAERNALLAQRMNRLLARKQWTDCIRDRHLELYGTKPTPNQYKQWTIQVNLVLFDKKHFNCNRDNMAFEEQRVIENFEFTCVRKSKQFPLANPEEILERTLANF